MTPPGRRPCVRGRGSPAGSSSATVLWFSFPGHCRPFLSYQRMYYVFIQLLSSGPAWLAIVLLVTVSLGCPELAQEGAVQAASGPAPREVQVPSGRGRAGGTVGGACSLGGTGGAPGRQQERWSVQCY